MKQLSEKSCNNNKISSFYNTGKFIIGLGRNKESINDDYNKKYDVHNTLLIIIVVTPEKELPDSDKNIIAINVRVYSMKSFSEL